MSQGICGIIGTTTAVDVIGGGVKALVALPGEPIFDPWQQPVETRFPRKHGLS